MNTLHRLDAEHGQSPWLDNLARPHLLDGTLARLVAAGIRGVTANPTIFARAIEGADAYDQQFAGCIAGGFPDTTYVDGLIGPDTVNTMPETTIEAFEDHGTLARTIDADPDAASAVLDELVRAGVDLAGVGRALEAQGVAGFHDSFAHVLSALEAKAHRLAA